MFRSLGEEPVRSERNRGWMAGAAAFAVVVVVAVAIAAIRIRGQDAADSIAPPSMGEHEAQEDDDVISDRVRGEEQVRSQRSVLQEFWGERYSEIEAEAKAKGIDLDKASSVIPWAEAEKKFLEKLLSSEPPLETRLPPEDDWPEATTQEFLLDEWSDLEIELTAAELAAVDSIVAPFSREIDALAAQKREVLQRAMLEAWGRGDYERAPLFLTSSRSEAGDSAVRRTMVAGGWCVDFDVKRSDWPVLDETSAAIENQKKERHRQVEAYLNVLSGR